jgi:hypothetical protein
MNIIIITIISFVVVVVVVLNISKSVITSDQQGS